MTHHNEVHAASVSILPRRRRHLECIHIPDSQNPVCLHLLSFWETTEVSLDFPKCPSKPVATLLPSHCLLSKSCNDANAIY